MADNIITHGDKNDDSDYMASVLSTPFLTDFNEIQCKSEPCSNLHNSSDEDPLAFDELSAFRSPISISAIKNPIVLLERCDKIWETLQLIKIKMKTEKLVNDDNDENKEKEVQYLNKAKKSVSCILNQPVLKNHNTRSLPFKFSVQKTRKLYPCTICGKQYLERRSLRKHSERVHGVILPLLHKRKHAKNASKLSNKKIFDKVNPVTLLNKESVLRKFVKCTLCQQKVTSIRKHLIHYHKIGGSSSMVEQLESSLLNENGTSPKDKTTLENISFKKSLQSAKMDMRDGGRIMDNEADTHKTSQVKRKRKYASSYVNAKKRFKLNNECHAYTRHGSTITQKQASLNYMNPTNHTSYQCDICLGIYASPRSLYKHKRNHIFRGETKENFHKVKCRYHNSPFNKKYKLLQSSMLTDTTVKNTTNNMELSDFKNGMLFDKNGKISKINQEIWYNKEMDKRSETTCICGRSFRNSNTLFSHSKNCEINKQAILMSQHTSVSSDSGIGLNITIKKLNDSYEIVGKEDNNEDKFENSEIYFKENNEDKLENFEIYFKENNEDKLENSEIYFKENNEDKLENSEIYFKENNEDKLENSEIDFKENNEDKLENSEIDFKENNLSTSDTPDYITENSVNLCAEQKEPDTSESSNYSKDHSVLKLHVTDEDVIIDIEDDEQIKSDKNNTSKQMVKWQNDERYTLKKQDNVKNLKNEQFSNKICTLKQMCQNVLDVFAHKSEKIVKNESRENSQDENEEIHEEDSQIKNQNVHQKNNRNLRSSNKQGRNDEKFDNLNERMEVCMAKFDPLLVCGYCNEQFKTISLYDNHQCIVKQGRPFDKFSLELFCFYCKDLIINFNEYDKHMKAKHFINTYHCYLCIGQFVNDKERLQHINLDHTDRMSCRFCNKRISLKVKTLHEGYHLGFGYPCHKCKKAYTNEKNLSYHNYKSTHPKTDNLTACTICLKSVKIQNYQSHMSKHKHHSCYFCGKMFSNKTGIEYHTMMYHGTQFKLKCNICGTRFFNKKQLKKHAEVDKCSIQEAKNINKAAHQ